MTQTEHNTVNDKVSDGSQIQAYMTKVMGQPIKLITSARPYVQTEVTYLYAHCALAPPSHVINGGSYL